METWADGAKFKGEYKDGLKDGSGEFSWADGSVFKGGFVANNMTGQGK